MKESLSKVSKETPYLDIHAHLSDGTHPLDSTVYSFDLPNYISRFGKESTGLMPQKCSAGIYPFEVNGVTQEDFSSLYEIAKKTPHIIAIGECGLDYRPAYREFAALQYSVFARQIEIANQLNLPLIVHQVRALDDTIKAVRECKTPVIFHGFSGSVESSRRIYAMGHYISFGAMILRNERTQQSLRESPMERIFFETDNQSDFSIEEIYHRAAKLLRISLESLTAKINRNFETIR